MAYDIDMSPRTIVQALLGATVFATVSGGVLAAGWLARLATDVRSQLAEVDHLSRDELPLASEIFDRHGEKIGEIGQERRYFVAAETLPPHVAQAFISAEDKDFREHGGIDPVAILRAALANLRGQRISQGASTITQQVARLYFLEQERTWARKVKEAILAVAIERRLTKDRILELYLNKIFLGNRSYGIEAAARNYFRKDAVDLSIGEAALLAGLPKSPSSYAPNRNPKRASERQAFVLRRMEEDGFLAKGDAAAWSKKVVHVSPGPENHWDKAPYFVAAVQKELGRKFELQETPRQGLKIRTTLDARLQRAADTALKTALKSARRGAVYSVPDKGKIEGAVFSLDSTTGAVLAMQGGASFAASQFDRSRLARRRIAGLMVPIYVSLALERGYTLASHVGDDPMGARKRSDAEGVPTIYDVVTRGLTVEAAPLYAALGNGSVLAHARRLGLEFQDEDLSLAFGFGASTPEEIARAYATFVNGGIVVDPYLITSVEDATGASLYQAQAQTSDVAAMSPQAAFITYHLLQESIRDGHIAQARGLSKLAGAASGATDDLHDAWFAGVLPKVTTAVWVGAEMGRVRLGANALEATQLATSVWTELMRAAPPAYLEGESLVPPSNVSFARIPVQSAEGVKERRSRSHPFLSGTEPVDGDKRF